MYRSRFGPGGHWPRAVPRGESGCTAVSLVFPVLPSLPSFLLFLLSPLRGGLIQSAGVPVLSVRIRPSESFVGERRFRQATGTMATEAGSEVLLELAEMKRMHGDLPWASESFEDARRLRQAPRTLEMEAASVTCALQERKNTGDAKVSHAPRRHGERKMVCLVFHSPRTSEIRICRRSSGRSSRT